MLLSAVVAHLVRGERLPRVCESEAGEQSRGARLASLLPLGVAPCTTAAVWRGEKPPEAECSWGVWHQERGCGGVARAVSAVAHQDMGRGFPSDHAPLAVGMRPLLLGMLGDIQYGHPLLDLLKRHRGLLPAVSTRLSR